MAISPRKLFAASEAPSAPLTIDPGTVSLPVERVLRFLPGRRLVGLGTWRGQTVVFKCFANEPRSLREYRHEYRALRSLAACGIAAPRCIEAWRDDAAAVLVLNALKGMTAGECLAHAAGQEERQRLLAELFDWLLTLHAKGWRQSDIHLDNFLRVQGQWHMLDAGACRRVRFGGAWLRRRDLAWLAAQFPPGDDTVLAPLLRRHGLSERRFFRILARVRLTRYRRMLAKTERDCTAFARLRLPTARGMAARGQREALIQAMGADSDPDRLLCHAQPLKQGNSATVVYRPEAGWVIKRYNVKSRLQGVKRRWKRSRARISWRAGHYLGWIGIDTAEPVGFLEERGRLAGGRAWLVVAACEGEALDRLLRDESLNEARLAAFERLLTLMHRFRISHGDMKASNFLVQGDRLILIDLDAVRFHRSAIMARRALRRDIRRLLRNWPQDSVDRQRLQAIADRVISSANLKTRD